METNGIAHDRAGLLREPLWLLGSGMVVLALGNVVVLFAGPGCALDFWVAVAEWREGHAIDAPDNWAMGVTWCLRCSLWVVAPGLLLQAAGLYRALRTSKATGQLP